MSPPVAVDEVSNRLDLEAVKPVSPTMPGNKDSSQSEDIPSKAGGHLQNEDNTLAHSPDPATKSSVSDDDAFNSLGEAVGREASLEEESDDDIDSHAEEPDSDFEEPVLEQSSEDEDSLNSSEGDSDSDSSGSGRMR